MTSFSFCKIINIERIIMKILKSQIISFAERKTLGYPFQEENRR